MGKLELRDVGFGRVGRQHPGLLALVNDSDPVAQRGQRLRNAPRASGSGYMTRSAGTQFREWPGLT